MADNIACHVIMFGFKKNCISVVITMIGNVQDRQEKMTDLIADCGIYDDDKLLDL